jgi:NAD(P)-dependent dehydrogenase (short-subunit alcohol dehydrogenase family)
VFKEVPNHGKLYFLVLSCVPTTGDHYEERELVFIQADLGTAAGCTKVVNEVTSHFGSIDILVSVVGASSAPSGGFIALSDEEWQTELNINLWLL